MTSFEGLEYKFASGELCLGGFGLRRTPTIFTAHTQGRIPSLLPFSIHSVQWRHRRHGGRASSHFRMATTRMPYRLRSVVILSLRLFLCRRELVFRTIGMVCQLWLCGTNSHGQPLVPRACQASSPCRGVLIPPHRAWQSLDFRLGSASARLPSPRFLCLMPAGLLVVLLRFCDGKLLDM